MGQLWFNIGVWVRYLPDHAPNKTVAVDIFHTSIGSFLTFRKTFTSSLQNFDIFHELKNALHRLTHILNVRPPLQSLHCNVNGTPRPLHVSAAAVMTSN